MSEEEIEEALSGSPLENFQLGAEDVSADSNRDGEPLEGRANEPTSDDLPQTLDDDHQSDERERFRELVRSEFGGLEVEKQSFLRVYAAIGRKAEAAKIVGISSSAVNSWLKDDPRFTECFEIAAEMYCERLEKVAHHLAVGGVTKGVYYKGDKIDEYREWDTSLLMFLLKANNPAKYREAKEVKHSGAVGHQHNHSGQIAVGVTVSAVVQEMAKNADYRDFVRSRLPGGNAGGIRFDMQSLAVGSGSPSGVN